MAIGLSLRSCVLGAALLISAACAAGGRAEAESANLLTAPAVSPSAASTYYGSGTTHTTGVAAWSTTPPEVAALARTLGGGGRLSTTQFAQNVFDYVRNNIDTEFRYGLGKGGRGALIDQSGTPFDQAELMVKVLRAGGVTASYQVGTITLTAQQFGQWSGLVTGLNQASQTFSVDAHQACQFLADGGIPVVVNGSSDCTTVSGTLSSLTMSHIWVSALGNLYDPSFKVYTLKTGIDVSAAMQCGSASAPTCGAAIVSAATSSSTTGTDSGGPYIQNINDSGAGGLNSKLQALGTNLQNYIQSNNRTALLQDIVGGPLLTITPSPTVSSTISYIASTSATWTGDIPDQYRTTLRVRMGSNNSTAIGFTNGGPIDQTFYADELAGRRLQVVNGPANMVFMVDAAGVSSPSCSTCAIDTAILDVNHPYAAISGTYGDDHQQLVMGTPDSELPEPAFPITIIAAFGSSSQTSDQHLASLQETNPTTISQGVTLINGGGSNGGYIVQNNYENDNQAVLAGKMLGQASSADKLIANLGQARITRHHDIGVVFAAGYDPSSTSWITNTSTVSVNTDSSGSVLRTPVFQIDASVWSILEGLVFAQSENSKAGLSAATYFSANAAGKIHQTVSGGISSISVPDGLATFGAASSSFLTPFGGGGGVLQTDPLHLALDSVKLNDTAVDKKKYLSVSPADGGATISATDLVTGTGGFPHSLPFTRSYASNAPVSERTTYFSSSTDDGNDDFAGTASSTSWHYSGPDSNANSHLGGGWTNNYDVTAFYVGDSYKGFGSESALDASTAIAAVWSLIDAARTSSLANNATIVIGDYWLATKLVFNSVTVNKGGTSESFMRLPDGSFNSVKASSRLVQTGEAVTSGANGAQDFGSVTFAYTGKDGDAISFDWSRQSAHPYCCNATLSQADPVFKADSWSFPDGTIVTFNYTPQWLVTNWTTSTQCNGILGLVYYCSLQAANPYYSYGYVLSSVSNNLGRSLTFTTVAATAPVSKPNPLQGVNNLSSSFQITAVTDETGRSVNYALSNCVSGPMTYRFACGLFTATGPDSAVTKYVYNFESDGSGALASTYRLAAWYVPSDQSNPFESVAYDSLQHVTSVTDKLLHSTTYYPGALAGLELWKRGDTVDALGNTNTTIFDQWNDLLSSTDPLGRTKTDAYDNARRKTLETNPEGDTSAFAYDIRSNVLSTTRSPKTLCTGQCTPITASTSYEEGPSVLTCSNPIICNKPSSDTSGNGNTTNYTWVSTSGLLQQMLSPADLSGNRPETDFTYQTCGSALQVPSYKREYIVPGTYVETDYAFNSANKCVLQWVKVDPSGLNLMTSLTFDALGNLTAVDGPRTDVTDVSNYTWDVNRRLIFAIQPDPDGTGPHPMPATKYTYDVNGQLTEIDLGTTTSTTGSGFTIIETVTDAYDAVGNKIQETAPTSVTQYSFDNDDRPLCTAVRMNQSATTRAFGTIPSDACTLSTPIDYGSDRITKLGYDAAGEVLTETRALGTSLAEVYATHSYTPNGKEASVYDALGTTHTTSYAYDGFDRLKTTTFADGTTEQLSSYDADGNVGTRTNRAGQVINYTYDNLDRVHTKVVPTVGSITGDTVTWAYDLKNEVTILTDTLSNALTSCYDLAGRLTSATSSTSGTTATCGTPLNTATSRTVSYVVDKAGNQARITWPDGYYVSYAYDALNHVTTATESDTSAVLATYAYDNLARRASVTYANGASVALSWSPESDLLTLGHAFPGGTANNVSYTDLYSPAHQITNSTISNAAFQYGAPANGTDAYGAVNVLNQYPNVMPSGQSLQSVTYDNNGNLATASGWTYAYDPENRLRTATGPSVAAAYAYDPLGHRSEKSGTGVATTFFLDDSNDNEIGEYDGSGTLLNRYVPGPAVNDPIAMVTASGTHTYFHEDKVGSVVAMSDSSGNLVGSPNKYDAYGNCRTTGGVCGGGEPFLFTGQRFDPETGLYYYRARFYSASLGRFMQVGSPGTELEFAL